MSDPWQSLFEKARALHETHRDVRAFCDFPIDLERRKTRPCHIPASSLMQQDQALTSDKIHSGFRDAVVACAQLADWQQAYKDTNIGEDFLNRFGHFELIGQEGVFHSTQVRSFFVYANAGLHYPWHHHPAEELYLVLAGEAEFMTKGEYPKTLRPGKTTYHATMTPHAMVTHNHPVLAYVLWRNNLSDPPLLTPDDALA